MGESQETPSQDKARSSVKPAGDRKARKQMALARMPSAETTATQAPPQQGTISSSDLSRSPDPAAARSGPQFAHSFGSTPAASVPEERGARAVDQVSLWAASRDSAHSLWAKPGHRQQNVRATTRAAGMYIGWGLVQSKGEDGGKARTPTTFGKMSVTPKEIPADGKTTAQATVSTTPAGRNLKWGFSGKDYGSTITNTGLITPGNNIGKDKESVRVTIKAEDADGAGASKTVGLTLWDAKLWQAKKDYPQFVAKTYKYPNFIIGKNGKFDVAYKPNVVNIHVKVKFKFVDDPPLIKFPAWLITLAGPVGFYYESARRAQAAVHDWYRNEFTSQVVGAWSKRYQFQNIRPPKSVWGKLNPTSVHVHVDKVDSGEHFTVEVNIKKKGGASVGGGVVELFKNSFKERSPWGQGAVVSGEAKRLRSINPSPILFKNAKSDIKGEYDPKLQLMGDYLRGINMPAFKISVVGHASTVGGKSKRGQQRNQALSEARARAVASKIKGGGLGVHTILSSGVGQTGATADDAWRKATITPTIDPAFVNKYKTIPHESGHMFGLGDEYPKAGADPTATHHALTVKAFRQEYADVLAARGTPAQKGHLASVMSVGGDVRIHHYVTFWSALCETTLTKASLPDPKFGYDDWKFVQ